MFRRILLILAASTAFTGPLQAAEPKEDGIVMKALRKQEVHWGCGLGALASWALYIVTQRRFSRLATSAYPQRQRRAALRQQLDALSRLIAKEKQLSGAHRIVDENSDEDTVSAVRQPDISQQRMQQLDMVERQLGMVQQEMNGITSKVDTANTLRHLFFITALALSGATVAPWFKDAPSE